MDTEKLGKNARISHINDIINKSNGHFISHNKLQEKEIYNIKTNHILILQMQSCIPTNWTNILKQKVYWKSLRNIQNSFHINKSKPFFVKG